MTEKLMRHFEGFPRNLSLVGASSTETASPAVLESVRPNRIYGYPTLIRVPRFRGRHFCSDLDVPRQRRRAFTLTGLNYDTDLSMGPRHAHFAYLASGVDGITTKRGGASEPHPGRYHSGR